ncbi:hypothetical protein MKW98_020833 [Papaver atlanticum]|uniref:Uncharacterized protein n=1 Tax=Papaver atlanticum TaxID=357466 RepID=A0AAD4XV03_9MAGN|nr:hypothetical protein MKW98_020833 [Papaver atlanticum]
MLKCELVEVFCEMGITGVLSSNFNFTIFIENSGPLRVVLCKGGVAEARSHNRAHNSWDCRVVLSVLANFKVSRLDVHRAGYGSKLYWRLQFLNYLCSVLGLHWLNVNA